MKNFRLLSQIFVSKGETSSEKMNQPPVEKNKTITTTTKKKVMENQKIIVEEDEDVQRNTKIKGYVNTSFFSSPTKIVLPSAMKTKEKYRVVEDDADIRNQSEGTSLMEDTMLEEEEEELSPSTSTSTSNQLHEIQQEPQQSEKQQPLPLTPEQQKKKDEGLVTLHQLLLRVSRSIEKQQVQSLLASSNLLMQSIYNFLESIPMSISIAKAMKHYERTIYPLVYVNKHFETITKFSRQEIWGRTCNFIQTEENTEICQKEKIRYHMNHHLPIRVAITNVRQDGQKFLNFLFLHPIFHVHNPNICSHYIGLQYELIGKDQTFHHDLLAVDDLMALLIGLFHRD
jgi:hypothetical protein